MRALSRPKWIGWIRRLETRNRRSAQQRHANRWLKILDMDLWINTLFHKGSSQKCWALIYSLIFIKICHYLSVLESFKCKTKGYLVFHVFGIIVFHVFGIIRKIYFSVANLVILAFLLPIRKYAYEESIEGIFCVRRKPVNFCHPGYI